MQKEKSTQKTDEFHDLAESRLKSSAPDSSKRYNESDLPGLIHELDVCKMTIELQREELLRLKARLSSPDLRLPDYNIKHSVQVCLPLKNKKPAFY